MEIGEQKTTFGSRLKEKRREKGWSQYYLAALVGCTNSNISYLEGPHNQQPRLETLEALARVLDWPINEARRLAGYPESDDNLTPLEIEDDFRLSLYGYKQLSAHGQEMVKKQIGTIISFVSKCEKDTVGSRSVSFEEQAAQADKGEINEMTMNELEKRIGGGKGKGKKK